jgi:hypothetical protein
MVMRTRLNFTLYVYYQSCFSSHIPSWYLMPKHVARKISGNKKLCNRIRLTDGHFPYKNYSRTRLYRHRFLRHLAYKVRYSVVPVNSSLLTITILSSVITTLVYNDRKYSVPFMTLYRSWTAFRGPIDNGEKRVRVPCKISAIYGNSKDMGMRLVFARQGRHSDLVFSHDGLHLPSPTASKFSMLKRWYNYIMIYFVQKNAPLCLETLRSLSCQCRLPTLYTELRDFRLPPGCGWDLCSSGTSWRLKMEPTGCPETSVQYTTPRCVISQKNADLNLLKPSGNFTCHQV